MPPVASSHPALESQDASRSKKLQLLGILSGFAAGAWLGAAEAPTKLVSIGISPVVISLIMVIGVFLARWSLPALILGTSSVRADVHRAPHLVIWALLAGCLWAVANTLTIYAIRDIGLSIAFRRPQGMAPPRIPSMVSGPRLAREFSGALCTSPTAKPT
jgi:drug/metabolite transporter (DMT)-like permease